MRRLGKIGVYGNKTRDLQRRLSYEAFGLSYKQAYFYLYLGSSVNHNPSINDVQTKIFSEVPDRAYSPEPIGVPIGMDPLSESPMDFSRFGILSPMTEEYRFKMHIDDCYALGRKPVIADVFMLPFYDTGDNQSFWEITDVDEKPQAETYTIIITATPLVKSRVTKEIAVDNSADDFLTSLMDEFDVEVSDDVSLKNPEYEQNIDPNKVDEIDYRDPKQQNFLDDPMIKF